MANLYGNICTCTRCNGIVHTIRKGDTLYLLSRHYNVSVNDIMNANRNVNIYNLRIGDEICIPVRRRMDMRGNDEMREDMMGEIRDNIREGIMEEIQENVINEMEVESMDSSSKVHNEEKRNDDRDRDKDRNRDRNRDHDRDRNGDRKLREIMDMDMTLSEFLKMLKEFDK